MNESVNQPINESMIQPPAEPKKGRRTLWIALGIFGGVLVLLIIAAVIVGLVFDPWGIVSRLMGKYDPIAQAIPPETQMFMNINLLQIQSKDFINLVNIFAKAAGEEEITDFKKMTEKMDESLEPEMDITFAGDILPWIGQYAGLGINNLQVEGLLESNMEPDVDFYLIVEVRDKKNADEFLVKVMDKVREEYDQGFIEQTYGDVTIYEVDTQYEEDRFAFGRSGNLLIASNRIDALKEVIDTKKGDSLGDTDSYHNLVSNLPKDRLFTFYMDLSFIEGLYENMGLLTSLQSSNQLEMLGGLGMSISTLDVGLQLDYIMAYNLEKMTEEQIAMMQIEPGEPMTASLLPQETYLYITSEHLDRSMATLQESFLGSAEQEEVDEAMRIFEEQYGINPFTDLFPYLDGEYAIGIFKSSEGLLADQLDVPINLLLLVESSDPTALLNAAEKVAEGLTASGQFDVLQTESNGIQFFELQDPYYEESAFVYAVKDNLLLISLDVGTIEDVYGDRVSLDQTSRYKDGWEAFPENMRPIMYIDVEGIHQLITVDLRELTELEEIAFLKPIKTIELASRIIDENLGHATMIVFIEAEAGQ